MEKEQKHNAASLSFDDQTKRKIAKFIKEFFVRNHPPSPSPDAIHAMVSFERGDGCGADGACVRRASCPTTRTHGGASEPKILGRWFDADCAAKCTLGLRTNPDVLS